MEPAFLSHSPDSESVSACQYKPAVQVRLPLPPTASVDPTFAQSAFMVASDAWSAN
jgi:hypothetical protein